MSVPDIPDVQSDCTCLQGDFFYRNFQISYLGGDSPLIEVEVWTCLKCDRRWLSVLDDPQIYDDAGKWYKGLISPEAIPSISQGNVVENALRFLSSLDWYYCGGLHWQDQGIQTPFKSRGTVRLTA